MKDTLKKFLSQRGDILSDDRSNQLIIRDIPSVIPVVDNLIRQLDRKSQQVEIEARVVSASRSFAQDIGVQLGFAGSATGGRSIIAGDSTVGVSTVTTGAGLPPPPLTGTASLPFQVNLAASAPTSGLFLGHRSPNFAVDFFITAAEAKGVGKLLSKPRVITQNNEKAIVKQGTKIPVQTTINNTISVQFIDAVLKLEVTPQITAEGTVFMDVLVENTQINAGIPRVQGVPALDTQSAETKVLVADGGTVVIGGIIVTSQRVDITEVPLLGSLPIIGHLFKRNNIATSSNELLFFLTPRVTPG
jgi:type IV pilus assembly protein PilQ